jgi:hypothetical protein
LDSSDKLLDRLPEFRKQWLLEYKKATAERSSMCLRTQGQGLNFFLTYETLRDEERVVNCGADPLEHQNLYLLQP